ncbi:MAG: hypothetical protein LH632_03625 [Rhodoferax sp.]|nr:hypothetical protein [Rhodoferax sp.]
MLVQSTTLPVSAQSGLRQGVKVFRDLFLPWRVPVNNVAVYLHRLKELHRPAAGYDTSRDANHSGHFLLGSLWLPDLQEASKPAPGLVARATSTPNAEKFDDKAVIAAPVGLAQSL